MKVLKFGGTSVGSSDAIRNLRSIVENQSEDCVVVVSALNGVTDMLIRTAKEALLPTDDYEKTFNQILQRHRDFISAIDMDSATEETLWNVVRLLLDDLEHILYGVHLVKDLSEKTLAAVESYGERISSQIVSAYIKGAQWLNALEIIKTTSRHGKQVLDQQATESAICTQVSQYKSSDTKSGHKILVCGGFISSDVKTGEITNLGRGGSDYTAALIAAALQARLLEIWTDVNGFMTADPRMVAKAYTIPQLTYTEAAELCNFGAKVIYPPTIYPVFARNIPISVRNTMIPDNQGTLISGNRHIEASGRVIKGLSSITGSALITIAGLSMVGVFGVSQRVFTALAQAQISVFLVSQASSENSITIGVQDSDCSMAVEVLSEEFQKEIAVGSMYPIKAERNMATVAIVGENMRNVPGIAGKLFTTLGRSGISVVACAQGASETNISFVVDEKMLRKTMNVLHDSFFLSENQVLNVFVCGVGTVGGQLLNQIYQQREVLLAEHHLQLNVVGIANSKAALMDRNGVSLEDWREALKTAPKCNLKQMLQQIIDMNIFNSVFVDCTASKDVAEIYLPLLEHNVSVVTANKIAASGNYEMYKQLKDTALQKGVKFLFETNVGAGLPIIGTINDLRNSGDKIEKIEAVLSGTLNFIFNEIAADVPLSETIRRAQKMGYSEPDPRIDLSGTDVIRKLVILTREAGFRVEQADVEKKLFIPDTYFAGSLQDFWDKLPELDGVFEGERKRLEAEGKRWRFVATMDKGQTSVELKEITADHPFYHLEGSNNIVLLTTERYHDYPMMIQGYGAGAGVTAAGVFANIMSIANI